MIYTGIDHHKHYSVACTVDAQGRRLAEAKIDQNSPEAFASYFASLGEPSEVVIEACWNWGTLYDLLEDTAGVEKVVLSHPAKNRIIADDAEIVRGAPDIIVGSWCGKKFRPEKVAARPGWEAVPAVQHGQLFEIKSADILQPGPAALTDGVQQLHRLFVQWEAQHA